MDDSGFDLSYADSRVADSCTLSYESSGGYTRLFTLVRNDRRFIAKTLKPEFAASSVHIDLLRKEYLIGSSLYHPAIVSMAGFEVLLI